MSDDLDQPQTAVPTPAPRPVPVPQVSDAVAMEVGRAVLGVLRTAASEGRLPVELQDLGRLCLAEGASANPDAALMRKPVRPSRPMPGTATIRAALRRTQDLTMAPDGSELARLRISLLAVMLCLAMIAGAIAYTFR
jgi:hypothetical protein